MWNRNVKVPGKSWDLRVRMNEKKKRGKELERS